MRINPRTPMPVLLLLTVLVFTACSNRATTKTPSLQPMNLEGIGFLAVLDFKFTGEFSFNYIDLLTSSQMEWAGKKMEATRGFVEKKTSEKVAQNIPDLVDELIDSTRILPAPPDPDSAYPGSLISDQLRELLMSSSRFTVMDQEEYRRLISESPTGSTAGLVDSTIAVKIGKVLGVDAILVGTGTYSVEDRGKYPPGPESSGYQIWRMVDLEMTYQVVECRTGRVLGSVSHSYANYNKRGPIKTGFDIVEVGTPAEAIAHVPEWRIIVDALVDQSLTTLLDDLSGESDGAAAGR